MSIDQIIIGRAMPPEIEALQALIQRAYRGGAAAVSWPYEGELATRKGVSCNALTGLIHGATSTLFVAKLGGRPVGTPE